MIAYVASVLVLLTVLSTSQGGCPTGCNLPITIYNDIKCAPIYANDNDCCPNAYDCSHIYNHTEEACHYKGKQYKLDEVIEYEDSKGSCEVNCKCRSSGPSGLQFQCPRLMDGCAEHWVGGYPGPRCYLRHEPNECCAAGQICPPFDGNAECKVNNKIYKEGELFNHPTQKCNMCSCKKGFEGKFEKPFCEEVQCYAEIKNSGNINHHCAPYYKSPDSCCPEKWICPNTSGKFLPPINDNISKGDLQCTFGEKTVGIGHRYEDDVNNKKVYCECVVPPLLTCGPQPFKV